MPNCRIVRDAQALYCMRVRGTLGTLVHTIVMKKKKTTRQKKKKERGEKKNSLLILRAHDNG